MAHREVQPAFACQQCGRSFERAQSAQLLVQQSARLVPDCEGLGVQKGANASLLIRDPNLPCATAPSVLARSEENRTFRSFAEALAIMAASRVDTYSSS